MPAALRAQEFRTVKSSNLWNDGRNVNGLRADSLTVSFAELYGGGEGGDYRNTYEAKSLWKAGARAETITHFDRISMVGAFSFEHTDYRKMCGSMSTRPGYYPVDFLEFTPGRKTRQTYTVYGGITADVADCWRIGGLLDFKSSNYTKRKDLRHTDYVLDITVAPSFLWHRGDWAAGASYIFSKNSETIVAEELGIISGSYYAFLDKGLRYGVYDVWYNSGLHLKGGLPTRENYNGLAVQAGWRDAFAEVEYGRRSGKTGEKQNIFYKFSGDEVSVKAGYRLRASDISHYFRAGYSFRTMENRENILEDHTENGVTTTVSYGSNSLRNRERHSLFAGWDVTRELFRFGLRAEWDKDKDVVSELYPYVETSDKNLFRFIIDFYLPIRRFAIGLNGTFRRGWVEESERTVSDEVSAESVPYRLMDYYNIENEYITTPSFCGKLSLRYTFRNNVYIEGEVAPSVSLKKVKYIAGTDRTAGAIRIGYTF